MFCALAWGLPYIGYRDGKHFLDGLREIVSRDGWKMAEVVGVVRRRSLLRERASGLAAWLGCDVRAAGAGAGACYVGTTFTD